MYSIYALFNRFDGEISNLYQYIKRCLIKSIYKGKRPRSSSRGSSRRKSSVISLNKYKILVNDMDRYNVVFKLSIV